MNIDVVNKFNELKAMAETRFGINCGLLKLKTTLRSTKMGTANMRFSKGPELFIDLNINAINGTKEQLDYIIDVTLPHEMAHIVNFLKPSTGKNHNRGWKRVCMILGGNGETKYSSREVGNVSSYSKKSTYSYNVHGKIIEVGAIRHKRLQTGTSRYWTNNVEILSGMVL